MMNHIIKYMRSSNRFDQNIDIAIRIYNRKEWTQPDRKVGTTCKDVILILTSICNKEKTGEP